MLLILKTVPRNCLKIRRDLSGGPGEAHLPVSFVVVTTCSLTQLQNKSLLCYVDYFELKATETLQTQEKLRLPLNYLGEFKLGAFPVRVITRNNFFMAQQWGGTN